MIRSFSTLMLVFVALLAVSCKGKEDTSADNDGAKSDTISEQSSSNTTDVSDVIHNSIMSKMAVTGETRSFASFAISATTSDLLMKNEGPYTVFAPSNKAFAALGEVEKSFLISGDSISKLTRVINNHVVEGKYGSADIVQAIRGGSDPLELTTISGETLQISMKGYSIEIALEGGNKATLGTSDINSENGVLHVVNVVLKKD